MSVGRINVYIGEQLRHELRLAALAKKQTIGEYLVHLLEAVLKVKGNTNRKRLALAAKKQEGE